MRIARGPNRKSVSSRASREKPWADEKYQARPPSSKTEKRIFQPQFLESVMDRNYSPVSLTAQALFKEWEL